MLREFLAAHGIDCLVQGEHHSSLLGAVGFIELRILVPGPVADEARTLLESFRNQLEASGVPGEGEGDRPDAGADDEDEDAGADDEDAGADDERRGSRVVAG